MLNFISALFHQKNIIKTEENNENKKFRQKKKEVQLALKELENSNIELDFVSRARLDIEKLENILNNNEAIVNASFGNILEEILLTLDLIKSKAIEKKNINNEMLDDYVIQKAIQNLK